MALPFFYVKEIGTTARQFILNEETSKHVVQVLRMQNGEQLQLTDGNGSLFVAEITDDNKKKCTVKIITTAFQPAPEKKVTIAISLVKNTHRFEWFLEKATEIGVKEIVPLLCSRTGKQHYRGERMNGILTSALLQSQQAWLPVLREPTKFSELVKEAAHQQKYIAHCVKEDSKKQLSACSPFNESIILIGPEGDFTIDEIELALQYDFMPVALGSTRLRTETAGIVSATLLSIT